MKCQECGCYDYTGASLIKCPSCEAIIGETQELPTRQQQNPKPKTPLKMQFWEVKDITTRNAVVYYIKAQSEPDAQGVVRKLYRQKGLKYNQRFILVSSMTDELSKISGYYVWEDSGDSKRVAQRTRLPTGEFV